MRAGAGDVRLRVLCVPEGLAGLYHRRRARGCAQLVTIYNLHTLRYPHSRWFC